MLAQSVGALLAAVVLMLLAPQHLSLAIPQPTTGVSVGQAFLAAQAKIVGPNAAIAVGATIALCGLFAGPLSGASMNPARALAPMVGKGKDRS